MKILNAIHGQSIGGVDSMFRVYAQAIAEQGHKVALLISDNGNDNYQLKNVSKIFKLKNRAQILDVLHLFFILLIYRPDIIICHSNRIMKWMRILKFFTKAKTVAVNHGISFSNSLHCDYIININQQISDLVVIAGHNKSRSFVLPNAIDINVSYQKKFLNNPIKIGIYGRLEERKGFDILIAAAKILQEKNFDFRLKIGGFETHKDYGWLQIKDLARINGVFEKCEFVGVVLDKKDFFKDVDIFCIPSREEPFGLVILEGFLHSTLVISSDTVGGKLLIKDQTDGLLFENGNADDLARKLITVAGNYENYAGLTKSAYLKLEKEFSFDVFASNLNQILCEIHNV